MILGKWRGNWWDNWWDNLRLCTFFGLSSRFILRRFLGLGFHLTPDLLPQFILDLLPKLVLAYFLVGFHLVQLLFELPQLVLVHGAVTLPQRFQLAHLPLLLCQKLLLYPLALVLPNIRLALGGHRGLVQGDFGIACGQPLHNVCERWARLWVLRPA